VALPIIWQHQAQVHFESIQHYLLETWGANSVEKFTKRVFSFLDILSKYPGIGSVENAEKDIRGFTLSSQTRLLYKISDGKIHLLAFYDLRMNPDSKTKFL
jgi:plasmid stabilization system protein ParE